jgi:hypothetical protein
MAHKKSNKSAQQPSATAKSPGRDSELMSKRNVIIALALVIAIIAGAGFWYFKPTSSNDAATVAAAQQTLQTSLAAAVHDADDPTTLSSATQLINGAADGRFTLSNKQLAGYHLDKAAAYTNDKQYDKVISESEAAAKLDKATSLAAFQYELGARNALGQRQQLIPVLQQLVQLEKTSSDPMRGSAIAGYQEDIQALQHNGEIHLQ